MRMIDADALKKDLTRFYDNEVTAKELIDEQPTVGDWISVKDRLPDIRRVDYLGESWNESNEVLVYVKDVPENFRHIYVAYIDSVGGWESGDSDWFNDYTVTHWMPLPEPPKEET